MYRMMAFRMTISDLEWLSKIFNDTERAYRNSSVIFVNSLLRFLIPRFDHIDVDLILHASPLLQFSHLSFHTASGSAVQP